MNEACNGTFLFFGPAPWGPGEGPKGQILLNIIKFQLQSQFQRYFNQTLCVFSHMKDIKHIRSPRSCARGGTWGYRGGLGMSKFFFFKIHSDLCGSYLHEWHMNLVPFFLVPTPWGLGEGPKGQISFNLNYKVNFNDFLNQTLCIFTQMKDI